ncbi:MAG: hypothetical protein K6G30_09115 [Acetatifactor sp.]|nr:hypothetical protein [Acetatifactor sp.]
MKSMANTMLIMRHQINQLSGELDETNRLNKRIADKSKDLLKHYIYSNKLAKEDK